MSESHEVRIESRGAVLAGTLTLPTDADGCSAIVAVHAASGGTRDSLLLQHLGSFLPEHGIATLIFDRRGEGASTGSPFSSGFEELAADVGAGLQELRRQPKINATKLGLWCHSQGGWIAPLVAAQEPDVGYLIAVSPSGVTAANQVSYTASYSLREAGYQETVIAIATSVRSQLDEYYRGNLGQADATRIFDAVRGEPWFDLAFLPDPSDGWSELWRLQMDFDVRPWLRSLNVSVLLVFGERDRWVPIEASASAWRSSIGRDADLT